MKSLSLIPLVALSLSLGACEENLGQGPVLHVASGYIEMGATPDRPAAGYFSVEGGPQPVALVAVTSDLAQRVDMHESVKEDGMMTMKPLARAEVPAKGEMEFAPGGKHLMIWNINPAAVRAGRLPMVFIFTNNDRIIFDLPIKQAAAPAADGSPAVDHGSMDHGKSDAAKPAPDPAKK